MEGELDILANLGMGWDIIINIGICSLALLVGSILRSNIKVFQKYLIPAPIIGGFLLLLFYNFIGKGIGLGTTFLGNLVYHLLNVSFIAMMLRVPEAGSRKRKNEGRLIAENTIALLAQYGLQCLFGCLTALVLIITVKPDLFPAIGLTLPLGFELGPGQAYSMTLPWEKLGFTGGTSVGLTMAAIGFIVGSVGGVILINKGVRRGWIDEEYLKKLRKRDVAKGFLKTDKTVGAYLTTDGESMDSFTYHVSLVGGTYLLSWGIMSLIDFVLIKVAGKTGAQLADSLWGINFVISMFAATGVRAFMKAVKVDHTVDNRTLNRINGIAVDMTVVASLGAISLTAVAGYWLPILILVIVGILITCLILPWYCSRLFDDNPFFRMLLVFGVSTGTLPTGLSLLRVVDPEFETTTAEDYSKSCGLMFFLAIPLILTMNMPAFSVSKNNPALFYLFLAISAVYVIAALIGYTVFAKKKAWKGGLKTFFYKEEKK